jgi:hypothetical protein
MRYRRRWSALAEKWRKAAMYTALANTPAPLMTHAGVLWCREPYTIHEALLSKLKQYGYGEYFTTDHAQANRILQGRKKLREGLVL